MYFILLLLALLLGSEQSGSAQTNSGSCEIFGTYKNVLQCAIEKHPEIQQAKILLQQNKNLMGISEQRPNPEISSQLLTGKSGEDNYQYTQVNLAHTFELGGKRDARIKKSEIQIKSTEFDLKLAQEQIYVKTYLAMVRLRQINTEIEIFDSALTTFERIQNQYKSRPRMTPEQKATYTIMDIAMNDYRLRRRPLINEARENERFLELAIGRKLSVRKDFYPTLRKKWPVLSTTDQQTDTPNLSLQKTIANLELAQAELAEANSTAWPDLKIGPSFETQAQGSQRTNSFGLNLSFAIPLFHSNGAGKSYASAGVSRAETALATFKEIENQQLQLQIENYRDAVSALETSISMLELDKKHREIENSFQSGVISSSFVIEIHRQMADFAKSLGEQELAAIEALAKIYSTQGRLLSEGL